MVEEIDFEYSVGSFCLTEKLFHMVGEVSLIDLSHWLVGYTP